MHFSHKRLRRNKPKRCNKVWHSPHLSWSQLLARAVRTYCSLSWSGRPPSAPCTPWHGGWLWSGWGWWQRRWWWRWWPLIYNDRSGCWKPPSYRSRLQCLSTHPLLCSSLGLLVQFDFSWEFTFLFLQITKSSGFKYFRVPLLENFCFSHQSLLSDVLDFLMFLVNLFQYQPDRCFPTNNRFSSVERRYRRKNWCFGQITEFCVENFFKILKNHRFFQSSGAKVTVSGIQPLLLYCHQDVQNHFWAAEMVSESLSDVLSLGTQISLTINPDSDLVL